MFEATLNYPVSTPLPWAEESSFSSLWLENVFSSKIKSLM